MAERREYTLTRPVGEADATLASLHPIVEPGFVNSIRGATVVFFMLYLTQEQAAACAKAGLVVQLETYDLRLCS